MHIIVLYCVKICRSTFNFVLENTLCTADPYFNCAHFLIYFRENQPNAVTGQKCVLKYWLKKKCFQVQSPNSKKNGVLKYHIYFFVTVTSEHPDAVTVKNCVLKYTPETCVLVMILKYSHHFVLINYMQSPSFLMAGETTINKSSKNGGNGDSE